MAVRREDVEKADNVAAGNEPRRAVNLQGHALGQLLNVTV